jgi:hypothetical protein
MINIAKATVKRRVCEAGKIAVECALAMTKDDNIGIRVPTELKKALMQIARNEGRSLAQLCEIFLKGGASAYQEEGPKYLQRLLSRQK